MKWVCSAPPPPRAADVYSLFTELAGSPGRRAHHLRRRHSTPRILPSLRGETQGFCLGVRESAIRASVRPCVRATLKVQIAIQTDTNSSLGTALSQPPPPC